MTYNKTLNLNQKFLILIVNLTFFFTLTPSIPPITGFTSIQECAKKFPAQFLLGENETINQFVVCLPQGIVVNEGGVVTNEGKILQDTETYRQDQHRLLRGNIPSKRVDFEGKLAIISSPGQENWYHWLLQVLPRLKILADSHFEFDKIYINNLKYSWQKESLKAVLQKLNISEDRLFLVEGDVLIQASTLIVPSVPFIPSKNRKLLPLWLKNFIHETFLTDNIAFDLPKKIYISRSKAPSRRITNEDALIKLLEKRDFVVLHLEDLSVFKQAQIFHKAEVIIGPHGSGFTNLIFSQPQTTVIEIDHGLYDEQRSYYKRFAALMQCNYVPFYADQVDEEDLEKDIYVNLANFKVVIASLQSCICP